LYVRYVTVRYGSKRTDQRYVTLRYGFLRYVTLREGGKQALVAQPAATARSSIVRGVTCLSPSLCYA